MGGSGNPELNYNSQEFIVKLVHMIATFHALKQPEEFFNMVHMIYAVFRIRIRIGSGFNRVSGSGSGLGIRIRIQGQEK